MSPPPSRTTSRRHRMQSPDPAAASRRPPESARPATASRAEPPAGSRAASRAHAYAARTSRAASVLGIRFACEHAFVSAVEPGILHADLDAFYASVEQRDDPRLRGKPVLVGGGVVLSCSYEARARGVRGAMGGGRARRLCPDAIVVPPRMSAYSDASKEVFKVFEQFSPTVEGLSIDEAFLDVRGLEHIIGTPSQIARKLRQAVRDDVGLPITVGVARTKFLAKVASGVAKPDGL